VDNPDLNEAFAEAMDGLAAEGMPEQAMTERELAVVELNERYFVAAMKGSVHIVQREYDDLLERHHHSFMTKSGFQLLYGNRHIVVGKTPNGHGVSTKPLGGLWLADPNRPTFRAMVLDPDGRCPPDVYNLWRGFGVEPKDGGWETIKSHLLAVICSGNGTYYDWLIGWLAYCVQHPGKPAEAALVLRGDKGVGKGLVGQMLMRIFRDHSLHISNSKHLVGNFNSHLMDVLFLFVDEAYWAGDKQGEGTLKALITERTLMIEPKGVDSFQVPNRLKIVMASNNDWVVPASADERRYFVLDVPETKKGDRKYFSKLAAAIEGDELAGFLDYLLGLDLSDFDHRNPPHTDGLNRQKLIGGTSVQKFWYDCLCTGTIVNAEIDDDWPESVRCSDLYNAYVEHANGLGDRHPLTAERLGISLRDLCPNGVLKLIRPRTEAGVELRPRHYQLESLKDHRAAFLKAMNIEAHEWPEVEGDS
jgi:Family of unknown function (DUF5906)